MFTLGAITFCVFFARFAVFRFQESPKYLMYRGLDEKAIKALEYIAKYNKTKCTLSIETFTALTDDASSAGSDTPMLGSGIIQQGLSILGKFKSELIRYKYFLGSRAMIWLTICVWSIYMWDFWGFTIAGGYLPSSFARNR